MKTEILKYHLQKLEHFGERVTPARKLILEILCSSDTHLTSGEILEEVKSIQEKTNALAKASRASVFRTLDLFLKLSIVHPSFALNGNTKFVLAEPDGHHAHLVCPYCLETKELDDCFVHDLDEIVQQNYQRKVSGHLLEIYSYCDNCLHEPTDERVKGTNQ
jgi:Fur family ferric uptake transcriptional regulator